MDLEQKIKKIKSFKITSLIFILLIGIPFIVAGTIGLLQNRIDPSWAKTSGTVVDIKANSDSDDNTTMYTPVVSYIVNNKRYSITSRMSSSTAPTLNEQKSVAYNPSDPEEAKLDDISASLFLLIFPVAGVGISGFGLFMFIKSLNRKKQIRNLLTSGQKIQGRVTGLITTSIEYNQTQTPFHKNISRKPVYKISVVAKDNNGNNLNLLSDPFYDGIIFSNFDFSKASVIVNVFMDQTDTKKYFIDISEVVSSTSNIPQSNNMSNINNYSQNPPTQTVNNLNSFDNQNFDTMQSFENQQIQSFHDPIATTPQNPETNFGQEGQNENHFNQ